jgi:hypothetical protein
MPTETIASVAENSTEPKFEIDWGETRALGNTANKAEPALAPYVIGAVVEEFAGLVC